MPSLQTLLKSRHPVGQDEQNLEKGTVFVFSPGTQYTEFCTGFCWQAPGTGTAVIEAWGPGGSGARMCCCGGGVPGNAGAYAKRTVPVCAGKFITGIPGFSCGNASALCFRGCSLPTQLCWQGADDANGCMCAQGGAGGRSYCSTSTSLFCCYRAGGFCSTGPYNNNCGLICNYFPGIWIGCGYGGDVNCCGGFSCASFLGCAPNCVCCFQYHIAMPAGYFSCGGGSTVTYGTENENRHSAWSGQGLNQFFSALGGHNRTPTRGIPMSYCWRSDRSCGCYDMQGCMLYLPPGVGGMPPSPCADVRDHGIRGGMGAVRIRFFQ
jgi:hypothetical protein